MGPQRIAGLKMNQNQIDQLAAVFRRDSLITEDNVVEAGLAKRNFDLAELNRELQRRFSSPSTGVVDCAVSKEKELSLRFKSYQELQDAISTGKVRVYDRVRIYKIKQKLGSKYVENAVLEDFVQKRQISKNAKIESRRNEISSKVSTSIFSM